MPLILARLGLFLVWFTLVAGAAVAQISGPPADVVRLTNSHVDFRVVYSPDGTNNLSLVAVDSDRGVSYRTNECLLIAVPESKLTLPAGRPFGEAGEDLFVLPQSQDFRLLSLGFSTERLPPGVFQVNLAIALKRVQGPGRFYVWQATSFGGYRFVMNTADGILEADRTTPLLGSHEHFNWGFSAPGIYEVTLQASGRRLAATAEIFTPESTFIFHVLPLPEPAAAPGLRAVGMTAHGELEVELTGTPGTTYAIQGATEVGGPGFYRVITPIGN